MGRSTTPTFRTEVVDQEGIHHMTWNCKTHGRPTNANAETFRKMLNNSYLPGGVNEHISKHFILHTSKVSVIRQSTGEVVAVANAPMFEVV